MLGIFLIQITGYNSDILFTNSYWEVFKFQRVFKGFKTRHRFCHQLPFQTPFQTNSWHSVNWITEILINILKNICYRQNKTIQGKTTKCIFHYYSLFIKMFLLKIRLWKRKAIIIVTPLFPLQTRNKVSYSQSLHLSLSSCNILFGANVP